MSRLGGQFAGILRVEAPAETEQALGRGVEEAGVAGADGSSASRPAPAVGGAGQRERAENRRPVDCPGIVREISHALASFGVNVDTSVGKTL